MSKKMITGCAMLIAAIGSSVAAFVVSKKKEQKKILPVSFELSPDKYRDIFFFGRILEIPEYDVNDSSMERYQKFYNHTFYHDMCEAEKANTKTTPLKILLFENKDTKAGAEREKKNIGLYMRLKHDRDEFMAAYKSGLFDPYFEIEKDGQVMENIKRMILLLERDFYGYLTKEELLDRLPAQYHTLVLKEIRELKCILFKTHFSADPVNKDIGELNQILKNARICVA